MSENTSSNEFEWKKPLVYALLLAGGLLIGLNIPRYGTNLRFFPGADANTAPNSPIDEILQYVDARYVDTVNTESLTHAAIDKMLEGLDPHTTYIPPSELEYVQEDMDGNFEGIGVEFLLVNDTIEIVTAIRNGPSEAAGIMSGDKIITINDSIVAGVKIEQIDIFKKLRGEKGSKVNVGILRGKETALRQITITRDVIPVNSLDAAYMLDEHTVFAKINRFSATTNQEFVTALTELQLKNTGMKNLILDLRGNPGGFLNEATSILSQFFGNDKLLVYTKGRDGKSLEYKSSGKSRFDLEQIVVLIDEGSASASEIVAGALQDHDRAWIVGRRTYGKGLVQEQYPLSNGGAVRITIARYFVPSGRCIQKDYKYEQDYASDAERRLKNGELSDASKTAIFDSTKYYTGMGRVVYGGGGITPDFFVPLDTTYFSEYFVQSRLEIPKFVAKWQESNDKSKLPKEAESFIRDFKVDDNMFKLFTEHCQRIGITQSASNLQTTREKLSLLLKARIAKVMFTEELSQRILHTHDAAVEKAMDLIHRKEMVHK